MVNTECSTDSQRPTLVPVTPEDEAWNRTAGVGGEANRGQSVSLAPVRPAQYRILARRGDVGNWRLHIWRVHALPTPRRDSDQHNLVGHLFRMARGEFWRPIRPVHYLQSPLRRDKGACCVRVW